MSLSDLLQQYKFYDKNFISFLSEKGDTTKANSKMNSIQEISLFLNFFAEKIRYFWKTIILY